MLYSHQEWKIYKRTKEKRAQHSTPLPTLCILVLCLHGCVAMFNMFQNIHFKRKKTLIQSTIMHLKTSSSKESDVNPIYQLQHMFKLKKKAMLTQSTIEYLKMSTSKESDVNPIYHNILKASN